MANIILITDSEIAKGNEAGFIVIGAYLFLAIHYVLKLLMQNNLCYDIIKD